MSHVDRKEAMVALDGAHSRRPSAERAQWERMNAGFEEVQRSLDASDLPSHFTDTQREAWLELVRRIQVRFDSAQRSGAPFIEPATPDFELSLLENEFTIGRRFLIALRTEPPEVQRRIGQLLFLHELYHGHDQALRSSNHHGVGCAGVILEELDIHADAFALGVLLKWDLREGGPRARYTDGRPPGYKNLKWDLREGGPRAARRTGEIAAAWVAALVCGIECFDRLEQPGTHMARLAERRLRRYLMWHLQRARARGLAHPGLVDRWLRDRLVVELAPLPGEFDGRCEKQVQGALPETELFISLGGRLVRQGRYGESFAPAALVEAVRCYDRTALARAMCFLVEQHGEILRP